MSLTLLLAATFAPTSRAAEVPRRPNVVILLADDLGYADLACYGNTVIKTPRLDRLAAEGVRFTDCYAAAPVCSPSRAALLTGRNPYRLGIRDWIPAGSGIFLRNEETTIAELLRDNAGYRTGFAGKWHLNSRFNGVEPTPGDHGFDHWLATQNNAAPSHENPRNFVRNRRRVGPTEGNSSKLIVDEVMQFIDAGPKDKPFLVCAWFHATHERVDAPDEFAAHYQDVKNPNEREYYGCVEYMDHQIGRLLDALDERGLRDNTVVFFTSDNGPEGLNRYKEAGRSFGSAGKLRGMKLHLYEGGIRVPGIVRWPGKVKAGTTCSEPVCCVDVLPTLADMASVKPPADRPLDGTSLLPLLEGKPLRRERPLYWRYDAAIGDDWRVALRDGPWKLLGDEKLQKFALYNLVDDPSETNNLAAMEPQRVADLSRALNSVHAEVSAEGAQEKPQARASRRPPNIVFVLADDLGWADLGCYGSRFHETPNLDRLAKRGIRFTNAYAAAPLCSPTRAAILTGRHPARLHLTTFLPGRGNMPGQKLLQVDIVKQLPLAEVTLAEALKPAGYVSGHVGKWHLGDAGFLPQDQGFAANVGGTAGGSPPGPGGYFRFQTPTLRAGNEQEYLTDRLTDEAERFIDANRDKPFFLYLCHFAVHIPLQGKPELVAKYQKKQPDRGTSADAQANPIYAAMLQSLDDGVGRVVRKLEELGLADNTLIVFTSDNGGLSIKEGPNTPATSNAPLRGAKGQLYEGGIRVPLIVAWPGKVKPGTVSDVPVNSLDFYRTFLNLAGVTPPADRALDGVDLTPLLTGAGTDTGPAAGGVDRDTMFWHLPHYSNQGGTPTGAVRAGAFKLVEHYEDGRVELFNLAEDPSENRDLSREMPQRREALRRLLREWRESVGAQMPQPNPAYDPDWKPAPPAPPGTPKPAPPRSHAPAPDARTPVEMQCATWHKFATVFTM